MSLRRFLYPTTNINQIIGATMERVQIIQSQDNQQIQISQNIDIEQLISQTADALLQSGSAMGVRCQQCFNVTCLLPPTAAAE
jgi:hypothetical protein